MLYFIIDNIFVTFGEAIFQQQVGSFMGTNCAPLLVDLFLYLCETEFLHNLVNNKKLKDAQSFNFTYRYIDVFSAFFRLMVTVNISTRPEIKETTETACLHLFF